MPRPTAASQVAGQPHPRIAGRLSPVLINDAVRRALDEDLGLAGDITTAAVIAADATAIGVLAARKPGIVAGLDLVTAAFRALDPGVRVTTMIGDGHEAKANRIVARIEGNARALLSAERVALNFAGRMSGIATLTRAYVDRIAGAKARIIDTRKTTPGLRAFEKYAVLAGGGANHRVGLFDAVLIKDNHVVVAGGIGPAIRAARANAGHMVKIEIEVDTLDQLDEALAVGCDAILLDNMTLTQLREAVAKVAGRALTEASGGVSLETVRAIAETGVDLISVGALTHSAPVLDLGLDFEVTPAKPAA
jgi:nicotinate-nucleotide pyrophosphorylase (carboxylating)